MNALEFESALREFELNVQKRMPSMVNVYLANRGVREHETTFNHFIENLKRQRAVLLRDIPRLAKPAQKIRYFNTVYNMDSQLRSMGNRDVLKDRMKKRRHTMEAPVDYDIGQGPEAGTLINVFNDGLLLKTSHKVALDHEVVVMIAGTRARGKAVWSIPSDNGKVETGIKLIDIPQELAAELNKFMEGKE
ncbi:MAG: hypothetical protein ABFD81_01410 [Syntrophaceae bacterium]